MLLTGREVVKLKRIWKGNEVVLFQGDSITDCSRDRNDIYSLGNGYPDKVAKIYESLFPEHKVTFINRAISGDRTKEILARYKTDIKEIQPDFMSIMVGINDVWRKYDQNDPTSNEQFEYNYKTILQNIKRDCPNTKIMIIEPYVFHTLEDRKQWHETLDPVITIVRQLAKEYADYFLPLDGILHSHLSKEITEAKITEDGVHPTLQGHGIIAYEYMKQLGIF